VVCLFAAIEAEKGQQQLIAGIENFDTTKLKHTETIEAEKGQQQLIAGIENFDTTKLKHTETLEKNPLPTKEGTNNGILFY
ncbi:uncharacterized protein LOC124372652, partial [Homalodisca vitripennis]|uniref:uncharacterized protein LOC124372652 n=1 Tax=Homalodisca vitripennis TaxID=197043 RepID=UPI001EEA965C